MGNITKVTKRDIFDLLKYGIVENNLFSTENERYPYYGRLELIDFLKRLYDLSSWSSLDPRVSNAEEEIIMHTRNGDYPDEWIFKDERFQLLEGEDSVLLNFLCEIFHPEVRDENGIWEKYLERINTLLVEDGYQLFSNSKLSGRDIFAWRIYKKNTGLFIPFSQRNKSLLRNKKSSISLPNAMRYQLFKLMDTYNETFIDTSETGLNYCKSIQEFVLIEINNYYIPRHYVNGELNEINDFQDFQEGTSPSVVFDVIEVFYKYTSNPEKFEKEINSIFKLYIPSIELNSGEIHLGKDYAVIFDSSIRIGEVGIKELISTAEELFNNGEYSSAVEKIWDAFERIKTYYQPGLDKKKSANKIINELSRGNNSIKSMFMDEFKNLTDIGNSYRIRHHEKDKIDINDELHFKYFYRRCLALISVILENIQLIN